MGTQVVEGNKIELGKPTANRSNLSMQYIALQRANAEAVAALESSQLQKGWEAENKATTQNTRSHQTRMCKGEMKLELRGRISEVQQRHAPTYTTVGGTCSFRTQLSDDQHYTNLHSRWGRHGHQSGVGLCTNA